MKLTVQGSAQSLEVSDKNFAAPYNEAVVHQIVTAYNAAGRAGTKAQKTRAEVRGGGIKPWKQKGTGRARAGTTRGPIWVGGGRAFAAKPRDHSQKVNRKMYRAAMRSVISELVRQERLVVVPGLELEKPRTRDLVAKLKGLGFDKVLILVETLDQNLRLAARNLPWVDIVELNSINPVALIGHARVLATPGVIRGIEERLS